MKRIDCFYVPNNLFLHSTRPLVINSLLGFTCLINNLKTFYLKVDKHIRKLDADLARFEADLRDKSQCKPGSDEKAESGKKSSVYTKHVHVDCHNHIVIFVSSLFYRLCTLWLFSFASFCLLGKDILVVYPFFPCQSVMNMSDLFVH